MVLENPPLFAIFLVLSSSPNVNNLLLLYSVLNSLRSISGPTEALQGVLGGTGYW